MSRIDLQEKITFEELLKNVPPKELFDFIVRQTQCNEKFRIAVFLEFSHIINYKKENNVSKYNKLLRNALADLYFDYDDIESDDDIIEITVLNQWLDKAQNYINKKEPNEAILICKACLEEFTTWMDETYCAVIDYINPIYAESPFDMITQTLSMQGVNHKELFDYCKSEILKPKYRKMGISNRFNALFMKLSVIVGSDDFIDLQDNLLKRISNKSSHEAKKILQRKIDFYKNSGQPEKADEVIKNNLQIESFRKELTEKLIAKNNLQEAKKLIHNFISNKENHNCNLFSWDKLLLQIAQKENDSPEIRRISFLFINSDFNVEYYNLYKSTFAKEEWAEMAEKLITNYEKDGKQLFCKSVADVLQAEKQEERLMKYIEKYLNMANLEAYYTGFATSFPEKTLSMFRQITDEYAKKMGRDIYERIGELLEKMLKIKDGKEIVKEMINQYRIIYKSRRTMMEILNRIKL